MFYLKLTVALALSLLAANYALGFGADQILGDARDAAVTNAAALGGGPFVPVAPGRLGAGSEMPSTPEGGAPYPGGFDEAAGNADLMQE